MSKILINVEDALANDAPERLMAKRTVLENMVDKIIALPRGEKRWKAAVEMYLNLNLSTTPGMTAVQENHAVLKQNRELRRGLVDKETGFVSDKKKVMRGGGDSDLQYTLCMPAGAKKLINLVDPECNSKENVDKMMKVFPEYAIAERL